MTSFVKHEACPVCNSRDNVGVWSDGHKYCFGCGWGIPAYKGMSVEALKQQMRSQEQKNGHSIFLPLDYSLDIAPQAIAWLKKYEISDKEIRLFKLGYSHDRHYLVFPVFDSYGNLLLWQGRYFGPNAEHPRYFTSGYPEKVYYIMGPEGRLHDGDNRVRSANFLVLTEDVVSGIKVSRQYPAMPLFGSQVTLDRIRKLSDRFTSLVIWLDRDKLKDSVKARIKALPFFEHVSVVVVDGDPKDYDDISIRSIISRSQADDTGFSK